MLIYLVPAFYKEGDKNVSELTIFANCYKSFIILLWISSRVLQGWGAERGINTTQKLRQSSIMEN